MRAEPEPATRPCRPARRACLAVLGLYFAGLVGLLWLGACAPGTAHPASAPAAASTTSTEVSPPDPAPPLARLEESTASAPPTSPEAGAKPPAEPEPDPNPPAEPEVAAVPLLVDANGDALPQTDEHPDAESPSLKRRLELLVEAIATDDPERAMPAFFPVEAYAQVKDIAKPERDWEYRLVAAFKRNIHDYHKQLGAGAAGATLGGLELFERNIKFMKPGSEGNRIGYYRALRSRLHVERGDGKEATFEVTSLISWRGEWYVVHLHGFK